MAKKWLGHTSCFIPERISAFEQIVWVNDSPSHLFISLKWIVWLNDLITWFNDWLASGIMPSERWLNVWCIWHTFLETLPECRSRHLTGWIKDLNVNINIQSSRHRIFKIHLKVSHTGLVLEMNCDWLFDMSVKRPHGRALANESGQPSVWRSGYTRLMIDWLTDEVTYPHLLAFQSIAAH